MNARNSSLGACRLPRVALTVFAVLLSPCATTWAAETLFVFRDVAEEAGLFPALDGIAGHAAAWGDVDGDGWLDLFVGTFQSGGRRSKPNLLLRNNGGRFRADAQDSLRSDADRDASGAVFADLTGDGLLDLYVSNYRGRSYLLRNEGGGRFRDVSERSGACPDGLRGRTAAVLDFDGDGRLDLLVADHPTPGQKGSRLFRNLGDLRFEDATQAAGLPAVPALGVAVGDLNGDGRSDVFLAAYQGGNRLFLNDGRGRFREAPGTREIFAWPQAGREDTPCGVAMGDVNGDGLPDILVGQHYKTPWIRPAAVRLYLHRGIREGNPAFEDLTEAAGLKPLAMKGPHVEIQDFDNDGLADLYVCIVKFAGGRPYPLIYKNLGTRGGVPRFQEDAWARNDFPTAGDRIVGGTGPFYEKMLRDRKIDYFSASPSADFDNDGRLDLAMIQWWPTERTLLLRNETPAGNWLQVELDRTRTTPGVNSMGIGATVRVYRAGRAGDSASLLGCREIAAGYGYSSGQPAIAHFGLGRESECDVVVALPHGKGEIVERAVQANRRLRVAP